mgnify:CR=1 FL=1
MLFLQLLLKKYFLTTKTPFQINEMGFSINEPLVN